MCIRDWDKVYAEKLAKEIEEIKKVATGEVKSVEVSPSAFFEVLKQAVADKRPEHLDYEECYDRDVEKLTIDKWGYDESKYSLKWEVDFGGSEGIYLDIWLEGRTTVKIATVKTLNRDADSFREMAAYGAEYVLAIRKFKQFVLAPMGACEQSRNR